MAIPLVGAPGLETAGGGWVAVEFYATLSGQSSLDDSAGAAFALRPLTNRRRNIRFRSQLGHELFELTFALVCSSGQDVFVVVVTQVFGQHSDTAQVKASVLEHRKDHRILA